jgi:hypothetical protein
MEGGFLCEREMKGREVCGEGANGAGCYARETKGEGVVV